MATKTKTLVADITMAAGLLPYLAVLAYVAWTSGYTGDAALSAVVTIMLGLGVAYVVALAVVFPAFLLSRSLAKPWGFDTRCAIVLRRAVVCSVFPISRLSLFLPSQ
jgi:hypothetical protein